LPVAASSEVGK